MRVISKLVPIGIVVALTGCGSNPPSVSSTDASMEPLPPLTDWPNLPAVENNSPPMEVLREPIDMDKLLFAIKQMESSGGINCKSRFEPNFLARYGNNPPMPELRRLFGDEAAASSYGPWQIMICVAWENDFRYSPEQLANPENNRVVAEFLIGKYAEQYVHLPVRDRVWKTAKRYNGGDDYADKVQNLYFGGTP